MPIPETMAERRRRVPREAPRRGRRDRRGADGALPRGRGARRRRTVAAALKTPSRATSSSRSPAASRRRTSARTRCSTCSSRACPRRRARAPPIDVGRRRPRRSSSRRSPTRSPATSTSSASTGARSRPTRRWSTRATTKERLGGADDARRARSTTKADAFGAGDIGAVAKLKDVATGDMLADSERRVEPPQLDFPEPLMSFAVTPKTKGDEDKVAPGAAAPRRGGPDAPAAPRPADRRAAPLGHEPGARRGRRRAG